MQGGQLGRADQLTGCAGLPVILSQPGFCWPPGRPCTEPGCAGVVRVQHHWRSRSAWPRLRHGDALRAGARMCRGMPSQRSLMPTALCRDDLPSSHTHGYMMGQHATDIRWVTRILAACRMGYTVGVKCAVGFCAAYDFSLD